MRLGLSRFECKPVDILVEPLLVGGLDALFQVELSTRLSHNLLQSSSPLLALGDIVQYIPSVLCMSLTQINALKHSRIDDPAQ